MALAAIAAAMSVSQAERELPTLCVSDDLPAERAYAKIEVPQLMAALRARIARRHMRVQACDARRGRTWDMHVWAVDPQTVGISIEGSTLEWSKTVTIAGLNAQETAQLIALHATDALRPSIDALLVKLGLWDETTNVDTNDSSASIEAIAAQAPSLSVPAPASAPHPEPAPASPQPENTSYVLGVGAGPTLGAEVGDVSPYLELHSGLAWGPFSLVVHAGGRHLLPSRKGEAELSIDDLSGGLGVVRSWPAFDIGLRGQVRLDVLRLRRAPSGFTGARRQYDWGHGLALTGGYWPWRGEAFKLGVAAQTWVWLKRSRFLVNGVTQHSQPLLDVFLGPTVQTAW